MKHRTTAAIVAVLLVSSALAGDEALRPIELDRAKLAGVGLPAAAPFIPPEDVIKGTHDPVGEILFLGKELIVEVYGDKDAAFRMTDGFLHEEYVLILDGTLTLTDSDGTVHKYVAGDSLVIPRGWDGVWSMDGNFRELVVIEREAYEAAYGELD